MQRERNTFISGLPLIPWRLRSGCSTASVLMFLGCCSAALLHYNDGGCYYDYPQYTDTDPYPRSFLCAPYCGRVRGWRRKDRINREMRGGESDCMGDSIHLAFYWNPLQCSFIEGLYAQLRFAYTFRDIGR